MRLNVECVHKIFSLLSIYFFQRNRIEFHPQIHIQTHSPFDLSSVILCTIYKWSEPYIKYESGLLFFFLVFNSRRILWLSLIRNYCVWVCFCLLLFISWIFICISLSFDLFHSHVFFFLFASSRCHCSRFFWVSCESGDVERGSLQNQRKVRPSANVELKMCLRARIILVSFLLMPFHRPTGLDIIHEL